MSETNSLQFPDQTTGPTRSADTEATKPPDLAGHALFERIGVGGMGEVYRCGDDALRRDQAIKVLKAELRGDADAEERFQREARLTGSLQHPGIVPVHQLGCLADGRLYYTMKLVHGRTLADLLRDEPDGPERLPRLLAVVEKVCQAMAFAHSKGVIHRDLKPSNVMIGEFGEVQVMDWGLAKELSRAEPAPSSVASSGEETVARAEEGEGLSRAGAALGTPSYMPPEQAAGDWDIVDERADVFALGAILCQVLTGRPPYHGADREDLLRRARRGDVAEALGRLERCGADAALVQLSRECLAPEREGRPRHAGVVAERLASYQAEVRERLRQAELERARAEVQAREQRKRRRWQAALAFTAILLLSGGAVLWRRQADADSAVAVAMGEASVLGEQARAEPLTPAGYDKAVLAAAKAAQMAHAGGASAAVRRQAEQLHDELQREAELAAKDRRLLARLLETHRPHEVPKYIRGDKGMMTVVAEPTAEELFAAAFRDWGLDVDAVPAAEAAARLKARPPAVVAEVIAALDEWAGQRRLDGKPEAEWRRLAELAAALDAEPDSLRRELREILARGRLPVERSLGVLSAALRPVPVPAALPLGQDCARLRRLAGRVDPAAEPVLGLVTLAQALQAAGEEAPAERLLRRALVARPREVVLYHTLGQLLQEQEPPRWPEAAECYAAARGLRPELGLNLATSLVESGRQREGLDLLDWLVQHDLVSPYLLVMHGNALLHSKGDVDGAIASYKKALELDPKYAYAHTGLGQALNSKGDVDGAIACYKKALDLGLDRKLALVPADLGLVLFTKGDWDGAIAYSKKAIDLDPKFYGAYVLLGMALHEKGDLDGAIASNKKALELNPKFPGVHARLGGALFTKGDVDGAIANYKKALELHPKNTGVHYDLGAALHKKGDRDGALASYQTALRLDPKNPKSALGLTGLGMVLRDKGDLDGAIACCKKALAREPKLALAHFVLGIALSQKGMLDEALGHLRQAVFLEPNNTATQRLLRDVLVRRGRGEEARLAWRKSLDANSPDHGAWYGYAELCLFLGQKDEYRRARSELLARFGDATDPYIAERAGRACLLLPGTDDELRRAAALVGRALAADPGKYGWARPYFLFARGLAEYRQGRFDAAAATLKGQASGVLGPCPRLVLAMAQHRRGHEAAARQTLAAAVLAFDWRTKGPDQDAWIAHALRREAEALILPSLPELLAGIRRPRDNDERLALLGACQSEGRHAAAARLYADAFAADPSLTDDPNTGHRYNAACSAALAAAGEGQDARLLPDKVMTMYRRWARGCLRDDLTAYAELAEQSNPDVKQTIQQRLARWRQDPDLASLRDQQALDRLADNERAAWQVLWRDVDELAKRMAKKDEPTKGRKERETPKAKPEGRSLPPSGATGR